MTDILRLARIQIGIIVLFVINKLLIRPFVVERDFSAPFQIFVLSFSNFCEAIVGTMTVTYLCLVLNYRFLSPMSRVKESIIYVAATVLAGVYVILQEFKIHNLGGENVYEPYDVLFSIIGLVV